MAVPRRFGETTLLGGITVGIHIDSVVANFDDTAPTAITPTGATYLIPVNAVSLTFSGPVDPTFKPDEPAVVECRMLLGVTEPTVNPCSIDTKRKRWTSGAMSLSTAPRNVNVRVVAHLFAAGVLADTAIINFRYLSS